VIFPGWSQYFEFPSVLPEADSDILFDHFPKFKKVSQ